MNIVQLIILTFVPGGFKSMKTPDKNKDLPVMNGKSYFVLIGI